MTLQDIWGVCAVLSGSRTLVEEPLRAVGYEVGPLWTKIFYLVVHGQSIMLGSGWFGGQVGRGVPMILSSVYWCMIANQC